MIRRNGFNFDFDLSDKGTAERLVQFALETLVANAFADSNASHSEHVLTLQNAAFSRGVSLVECVPMTWDIGGTIHRVASPDEISALQALDGAPHVTFACTSCGAAHWHAKNLALASSGRYSGARNIFYAGKGLECTCSPAHLRCIVPE
jgi:hypothetical protein